MEAMQNCGHVATPDGIWSGFMTDPLGYTWCAACCGPQELALMSVADTYTAYVSGNGQRVTTWSGHVLGTVTDEFLGRARFNQYGERWFMRSVRVSTMDGREWYGRGSDRYNVITLRACSNSRR